MKQSTINLILAVLIIKNFFFLHKAVLSHKLHDPETSCISHTIRKQLYTYHNCI